jgi:hypothetical protein
MASSLKPLILTFAAGAAITKGMAVKFGADDEHVVKAAAATDDCIGIAQNDAAAAEDPVEVALPGGGGKALLQATVVRGNLLVSHTDGKLKPIAAANDRVVAMAMASGVAGDIIPVQVTVGQATATE